MILLAILAGTLAGGVLSVLAAATLTFGVLRAWMPRLVAFAAGTLLGVALLDLLPHALEGGLSPDALFATLLAGLVAFFLLEHVALWRNARRAHAGGDPAHARRAKHPAGAMILVGDGVHNFVDGVLIAAAFLVDPALGTITTIAVIAHEIPQEIGDFLVLVESGYSRREALAWNLVVSGAAIAGGVAGYAMLSSVRDAIPVAIVVAAASLIYVAIADLVPMLHREAGARSGLAQLALMVAGIGMVAAQVALLH